MEVRHTKWLFQNATEIGNGEPFLTGRNNELTIYITGDSSSRTINFEGADAEENWFPVSATKIPENTQAISTTGTNEVWSIPLSRWHAIRCRISAINGGSVRISGRAVSNESSSLVDIPSTITSAIDQTTDGDTNRVVAKISQEAGENVVKATDLETLITTLNGKIDTLDAVIDTIKDTIIDKVTVETTGVSDILTLLTSLDVPGYGDEIDVSKYGMCRVHITKNNYFNGTLTFQGLISGSAYKNIPVRNVNTGILTETISSVDPPLVVSEDYIVDVRGLNKIRIQATYTTAGDVSVTGRGEPWSEIQYVNIANQEPINMQLSGSNIRQAVAITPDDDNDLTDVVYSLTCAADGVAYVDFVDGGQNIPINLISGYWSPIVVKRVRATNTTATGIVGQVA